MTAVSESAVWIDCEGAQLLGVLAEPLQSAVAATVGILIVVGGPQYRVGSHRQFALLARRLAVVGFPTMRFDYRGMGDSTGEPRSFVEVEADIAAAAAALRERAGVAEVVLWGLCDGASALLLGVNSTLRADGLVLVNPWVRSDASLGATRLKHYYTARLASFEFWRKLLAGGIDWSDSIRALSKSLSAILARAVARLRNRPAARTFQEGMAQGLQSFDKLVLLALSGNDLTAREFIDHAQRDPSWQGLLDDARIRKVTLERADHTFSSAEWRRWLEDQTLAWLRERTHRQLGSGRVAKGAAPQ